MSLDELIAEASRHDNDPAVRGLADVLREWRDDGTDVHELARKVERYFGVAWIADTDVHQDLYRRWAQFKAEVIERIGGMTMNERLHYFGLSDRCDDVRSPAERGELYAKVLACE